MEDEGEFIAYKMTRTLVINPTSYEGLIVKKIFSDGKTYRGTISLTFLVSSRYAMSLPYHRVPNITSIVHPISGMITDYYDHKQWWKIKYDDNDEEDWAVIDMKRCVHYSFMIHVA